MSESKTSPLTLDEFSVPSYAEWRAEAEATLKGASFEKKLITKTFEGLDIQPIYRKEDLENVPHLGSLPGETPYVRGTKTSAKWEINEAGPCTQGIDPLARLVRGMLDKPLDTAFDELAKAERVGISTRPYHNAGGNAVQELAFAIATGLEYLRQAEKRGVSVDQLAPKCVFGFAMGSDFFMGIAKLRAARLLWSRVVAASGGNADSQKMRIYASTSLWNKTKLDPYVNMLRNTTEAFSAVVGGADNLYVAPFDEVVRPSDEFSTRIARNTQTILAEECHFDHVVDPAGGSYYVETLTAQIANAAWAIFQQIEKAGGMVKALEAGIPQQQVKAVAAKKAEAVAQRRVSLIGVNVYANATEKPLEGSSAEKAPCGCNCGGHGQTASGVETLAPVRGAEPFEKGHRRDVELGIAKNDVDGLLAALALHFPNVTPRNGVCAPAPVIDAVAGDEDGCLIRVVRMKKFQGIFDFLIFIGCRFRIRLFPVLIFQSFLHCRNVFGSGL